MTQRNRFFAFLGLLLIIVAIYYFFSTDHSSDLVLIGTVDANQVVVSPKISGRIERLAVDEGTEVKAGDTIAVLDSQELTVFRVIRGAPSRWRSKASHRSSRPIRLPRSCRHRKPWFARRKTSPAQHKLTW
jgi:Biotin-lipoyl like